jgi:hypothetical protein
MNSFWDITPCGCSKGWRFGGTYRHRFHGNQTLDSSKLEARIFLSTDGEDGLLQRHHRNRVYLLSCFVECVLMSLLPPWGHPRVQRSLARHNPVQLLYASAAGCLERAKATSETRVKCDVRGTRHQRRSVHLQWGCYTCSLVVKALRY